ncbi:hypothetical protein Enr8_28390 [Blastopirellula retiformator]|uniref:Uncharacterized protein n=2 Tax=Blastopirellula retiformator TaxID=2527970 RepID=A0A5C5V4X2_9BACT|nr:hypothetical protein Enr8_28390 [Blastopirellula retiformator]
MFPLKRSAEQLSDFIDKSKPHASGWIGFYWGKTPEEYRSGEKSIGAAITLAWLEMFQAKSEAIKH